MREFFEIFSPSIYGYAISAIIGLIIGIYRFREYLQADKQFDENYKFEVKNLIRDRESISLENVDLMTEMSFWELIERIKAKSKISYKNFLGHFKDHLFKLNDSELIGLYYRYLLVLSNSNNHKLIGAFNIIAHANIFQDYHVFCSWLISRGQATYNNSIYNPELIKNVDIKEIKQETLEDLILEVFTQKFKKLMPEFTDFKSTEISGEEIDGRELPDVYPELFDKFVFRYGE